MNLTITPKIISVNNTQHNKKIQQDKNHTTNSQIKYKNIHAYKDFNIMFTGRTPENFYAQDFNRNNMPSSMKEYLDYNYEERQHIPPEQMMREVFKYIELADNF